MWKLSLILALCAGGQAADASRVQDLLRTAGKAVQVFWDEFGAINCTEVISQSKLDRNGKAVYQQTASYDYLVLMRETDDGVTVAESRVETRHDRNSSKAPLLVTSGFPLFLMIFHPHFQHSFEFSQPLETELSGRRVLQVKFRQIHNAPAPSCLRLRGRDYPLEWAGTAWLDRSSGAIIRIEAALESNTDDLGLKALIATVTYAPVTFADSPQGQWLPSTAVIEAVTPLQHWKNTHQFTNYKHFSVNTTVEAGQN